MDKGFDPYWEWLRIPTDRRPPTHYELLELPAFETNTERIREAATRRMAEILRYRLGEHAGESRRLQNDISRALNCLSDSAQKQRYDIQLRAGRPGDAASAPPPIVQAYLHAEAGAAPTGRSPSPGWTSLPESFGPYRIERTLGEGAMGTVYLARDTKLGRQVAIKVPFGNLDERSEWLERFRRECRATALFNHPNLCTVYEAGQVDGWPYLAMAYIEGRSLAEWSGRPMPARQAASLVMKVARGMSEAHRLGVLHRDLKPTNIMLDQRQEPIVLDFGLTRRFDGADANLTQSGAVLGTPSYMPPEQVTGQVDQLGPACDIYSLGVILYQLLCGKLPFEGPPTVVLGQILAATPLPPSARHAGVDPALEAICLKAMAKRPSDRYLSMNALEAALSAFLKQANVRPSSPVVQSALVRSPPDEAPPVQVPLAPFAPMASDMPPASAEASLAPVDMPVAAVDATPELLDVAAKAEELPPIQVAEAPWLNAPVYGIRATPAPARRGRRRPLPDRQRLAIVVVSGIAACAVLGLVLMALFSGGGRQLAPSDVGPANAATQSQAPAPGQGLRPSEFDLSPAAPLLLASERGPMGMFHNGAWSDAKMGDPPGVVRTVLVDSGGGCWFGGETGVLRIKGGERTTFVAQQGLPAKPISHLCEDRQGRIWASSFGDNVAVFESDGWSKLTVADGLCWDNANGFAQDARGRLWVATDRGVSLITDRQFSKTPFVEQLGNLNVKSIASDKSGRVLLGCIGGLCVLDGDQILKLLTVKEGLPQRTPQATFVDRRGRIWLGTWGGGVVGLDPTTLTISPDNALPRAGMVGNLCEDPAGNLYLASLSTGLWRLPAAGDRWEQLPVPQQLANLRFVAVLPPEIADELRGNATPNDAGSGLF